MSNDKFFIAQIGRTIGLWGDLKFHLHTDFPEQFKVGQTYKSNRGNLTIADINEGQYFWFDVIGCVVKQDDEILGVVDDIQRMADTDYLVVKTDASLIEAGLSKEFLLPYIDRYIIKVDTEEKIVYTKDAKDILEAS